MGPAVWASLSNDLQAHFEVHCLALPGHGGTPRVPGWSVASLASEWLARWPEAYWLGWSLGAQVALAAASQPGARLRGTVLLGGTPRFTATQGWSCAMQAAEFEAFCQFCDQSPRQALQQFLGLQVLGSEQRSATLRTLRETLATSPEIDRKALLDGLRVLRTTDLRGTMAGVQCPVLWISGERDQLTPCDAANRSSSAMPHAQVECVPGAGHALLISHQAEVLSRSSTWLLEECA